VNLSNAAAFVVGAVLVYAGVSKILAGRSWLVSARRLGVPPAGAFAVMVAEVVIGLGVVLGDSWRSRFLAAAAVLLLAFTMLLAWHLRAGERPPCACFGGSSKRPIGVRDIVRNFALLILVIVALAS
jgi:uncharacterized membrane protein YphA (DoxX/SURF4 family)